MKRATVDCHCLAVKWWVWKIIPLDSSSGYILVLQSIICHHNGFESGFLSKEPTADKLAGKPKHCSLSPEFWWVLWLVWDSSSGVSLPVRLLDALCAQTPKRIFWQLFPIPSQLLPPKKIRTVIFFCSENREGGEKGKTPTISLFKDVPWHWGSWGSFPLGESQQELSGMGPAAPWLSLQRALRSLPPLYPGKELFQNGNGPTTVTHMENFLSSN